MCSKVIPLYIYREGDPHSFEDSIGTVLGGDLLQLHRRLLPSIPVPPGVRILLPPMWLQPQAPPPLRCPPDPCGQMGWGCERSRPRGSKRDRESCEGQVLLPPALFDPPPTHLKLPRHQHWASFYHSGGSGIRAGSPFLPGTLSPAAQRLPDPPSTGLMGEHQTQPLGKAV